MMEQYPSKDQETAAEGRTYELSLKGEGITVDRHVDEAIALQVLAIVMGGAAAAGGTGQQPGKPTQVLPGATSAQSLREYLDEADPKRNVDTILAIAAYLNSA